MSKGILLCIKEIKADLMLERNLVGSKCALFDVWGNSWSHQIKINIVSVWTLFKEVYLTLDLPVMVAIFSEKKPVLLSEGFRGAFLLLSAMRCCSAKSTFGQNMWCVTLTFYIWCACIICKWYTYCRKPARYYKRGFY